MNTTLQVILSAILQGLTEFFPVSSSGHLVIFHRLLGIKESIIFDIVLHVGTLFAVVIYFWGDCLNLIRLKDKELLKNLFLATAATFLIVIFFNDFFEGLFQKPKFVGYAFILTGLWIAMSLILSKKIKKTKETPGFFDSVLIGIAQGIAVIPGISRSGATISTGFILGIDKIKSFKFAILLSIPAIAGSLIFKFKELSCLKSDIGVFNIFIGFLVSFGVGILAIGFLKKIIVRNFFFIFAIYCFLSGLGVLIFVK